MRCNLIVFLVLLAVGSARETSAADKEKDEQEKGGPLSQASLFASGEKVPWRGSQVVLRNALSAISLSRSAEQTYNPYYAMTWGFRPWWWFVDWLYVRADLEVVHELTEADETTYANEALLEDLHLAVGGSGLWTIPYVGVHLSADLVLTLPTSKASQARTLVLGLGPGFRLSRSFPLLKGLIVGYNLRVTPYFHRYTTSERETPLIPGCSGGLGGCDPYLNTGVRNPMVRFVQTVDVSQRFFSWLGASLALGHAIDWLHGVSDAPVDVSHEPVEDQNRRFLTFFELAVSYSPIDLLEIALGYSALHPQLAPDSTYYVPFFNRYSVFFLDLKLQAEGVVSRLRRIWR
jgi:hypothetical protein